MRVEIFKLLVATVSVAVISIERRKRKGKERVSRPTFLKSKMALKELLMLLVLVSFSSETLGKFCFYLFYYILLLYLCKRKNVFFIFK